jgi:hypothetical protein
MVGPAVPRPLALALALALLLLVLATYALRCVAATVRAWIAGEA